MRQTRSATRWPAIAAALLAVLLTLTITGCSGNANSKEKQARELLPASEIDTSDGLRIDGELVADQALYDAAKGKSVALYSGAGKEAEDLTAARFFEETGISIKLTRLPTNKLAERVLSEHGAGQLRADVIRVTDPQVAQDLDDAGVFAPYATPFNDLLIEQKVGVRDNYLNAFYFVNAMGYNSAMIEENPPSQWEDLTDPRYRDKLGIVAITTGGTLKALANFQIDAYGPEFLRAQAQQNPRIFDSTSTEVDALARGEIEIASLSFNNAFAAELAGAPIRLVIPDDGVSGSEALMGMTASGVANPAAQVFMNWTMSKAGQRFAGAQGFVPARTDIGPVKSGDYQLPSADSPQFHLFTEEEYEQFAARDEELWKHAFDYVG